MRALMNHTWSLLLAASITLLPGCNLLPHDQLEANLRQSESSVRNLEQQLATARGQLRDQEREIQLLREPSADSPFRHASSSKGMESELAWGAVSQLRIHSLASGVLREEDGQLFVSAIIQPLDQDAEVLKVAGDLKIQVQLPGKPELLSDKSLSSLDSRNAWSNGLVARGFQVRLPISADVVQKLEPADEVLVTATLSLAKDRQYQATAILRVPQE